MDALGFLCLSGFLSLAGPIDASSAGEASRRAEAFRLFQLSVGLAKASTESTAAESVESLVAAAEPGANETVT